MIYFLIRTKHGKSRLVLDCLLKHEQITDIHEVYGRYDIICKVETETKQELREFIQNKLWITQDIERSEPLIISDPTILEDTHNRNEEEHYETDSILDEEETEDK